MSRRMDHPGPLAIAASLSLLGACSFFSDFPDEVEPLGAGGGSSSTGAGASASTTDGAGSTGGAPATTSSGSTGSGGATSGSTGGGGSTSTGFVCEPGTGGADGCTLCRDCWSGTCACPTSEKVFELRENASAPLTMAQEKAGDLVRSTMWITDVVYQPGPRFLLAHGSSADFPSTVRLDDGQPDVASADSYGIGLLLDAEGTRIATAGACTFDASGENPLDSQEVFFHAGTLTYDDQTPEIVIGGAFEGEDLVFFTDDLDCTDVEAARRVDGPHPQIVDTTPFLVWLDASGDVAGSVTATKGPVAYVSDVADLRTNERRVVATGATSGSLFDGDGLAESEESLFLLTSRGLDDEPVFMPLDMMPCDGGGHRQSFSGLDTSVAVDESNRVWLAGTGCDKPTVSDHDESFIANPQIDASGAIEGLGQTIHVGSTAAPVAISRVAVSGDLLVVAGTYWGEPAFGNVQLESGDDPEGGEGDGFVVAYDVSSWTDQSNPIWTRRLRGDGGRVRIRGLDVRGGRVVVAGNFGTHLQADQVEVCLEGQEDPRTRAFFAELDPSDDGAVRWIRVEGSKAQVSDPTDVYVMGTAIGILDDDRVLAASRAHGTIKLECNGGSTGEDPLPVATLWSLTVPPP